VAALILFPAIDLKDGRCVRLVGDMDQATVFADDPAAGARLPGQGFTHLHVVDSTAPRRR
jgi:phosphoribosylformimino-5-aminoimidazole carboxamide ribotide isomerase